MHAEIPRSGSRRIEAVKVRGRKRKVRFGASESGKRTPILARLLRARPLSELAAGLGCGSGLSHGPLRKPGHLSRGYVMHRGCDRKLLGVNEFLDDWTALSQARRRQAGVRAYSLSNSPEPPSSVRMSFCLGKPSLMRSTVSA
jgi:hypothetical protein